MAASRISCAACARTRRLPPDAAARAWSEGAIPPPLRDARPRADRGAADPPRATAVGHRVEPAPRPAATLRIPGPQREDLDGRVGAGNGRGGAAERDACDPRAALARHELRLA